MGQSDLPSLDEVSGQSELPSVEEFVKKEGKWFNYIKGKTLDKSNIDTTLFSVQGIGVSSSIEILGSSVSISAE